MTILEGFASWFTMQTRKTLAGTRSLPSTEPVWPRATPGWRSQVSTTLQCHSHCSDCHWHSYSGQLKINLMKFRLLGGFLSKHTELYRKQLSQEKYLFLVPRHRGVSFIHRLHLVSALLKYYDLIEGSEYKSLVSEIRACLLNSS